MRQKNDHPLNEQALRDVARVLASIHSEEEMTAFLTELFTPTELHDFALRWKLLQLLERGTPQRQIAHELRISLCKITRGSRILKQAGSVCAAALKTLSKNQA